MTNEKSSRTTSLRSHLMVLVLVATLPALAIILYAGVEMQQRVLGDAKADALAIVHHEGLSLQGSVDGTRSMLAALAEIPEVRTLKAERCNPVFKAILEKNTSYDTLRAVGADGYIFASAAPMPQPIMVADRKYYRDAKESKGFVVGEYLVSRATGKAMINYGYPVLSPSGELLAVLQVGYDLDRLPMLLGHHELSKGISVVVTDHRGTVLYQMGSRSKVVGVQDAPQLFGKMKESSRDEDTFSIAGETGARGFYAFKRLRLAPDAEPYFYVRAGFSEELIAAESNRLLLRNITLMVAAGVVTLFLGARFVRRVTEPVQLLVENSSRLAAGSYEVELPESTCREIGRLNDHFRAMVRAVQDRERELQDHNEELAAVEEELRQQVDEYATSQDQLLSERNKLETILTCMGDGLSIQDPDFRVMYQNEVHKRMVGDARGRFCYEAYQKRTAVCDGCHLRLAFEDGKTHQLMQTLVGEDGTRYFEIMASPLRDGSGTIVAGIELVREITDRKRTEAEISRLNSELEKRVNERTLQLETANRELESFCYSVSHDLRAPLRHMSGFSRILVDDFGDRVPEEARHFLNRIYDASDRMGNLIDDLLELSRVSRQEMRWEAVNLSALAQTICQELRESSPERNVHCTIAESMTVNGDPRLLRLVLENLLGNAWKYSCGKEYAEIGFGYGEQDGEKFYFVRDNGVGFDMAYVHKLFMPFQRLHGVEFEGTGVGLASVKRIINRHGGRIWADAVEGEGATFSFTLADPSKAKS